MQGALQAANEFRERAKQRVVELRPTRQQQIADLKQRILEDADVYARSAETKKLLFLHAEAAKDYDEARRTVADWDPAMAADYRSKEIDAYLVDAELRGTDASLSAAEQLAGDALGAGASELSPASRAVLGRQMGRALLLSAAKTGSTDTLREAVTTLETARGEAAGLPAATRAGIEMETGLALAQLASTTADIAMLRQAEERFQAATSLAVEAGDGAAEAEARFHLLHAMYLRWTYQPDPTLYAQIEQQTATIYAILGNAKIDALSGRYIIKSTEIGLDVALRLNRPDALNIVGQMTQIATSVFDRDRFPLVWAEAKSVQGQLGLVWAQNFGDNSHLFAALEASSAAREVYRQANLPTATWQAGYQNALILAAIGNVEPTNDHLEQALQTFRELQAAPPAPLLPAQQTAFTFQIAQLRAAIATRKGNIDDLQAAVTDLEKVFSALSPQQDAISWRSALSELGKDTFALASLTGDLATLRRGADYMRRAVDAYRPWAQTNAVAFSQIDAIYVNATANLALASRDPTDLDTAIAAATELHGLLAPLGNREASLNASNTLAYLLVQRLRANFDDRTLAQAESLTDETLAGVDDFPYEKGYFQNTACELRTEKARHERDLALANSALDLCRSAQQALTAAGQTATLPTVQASIARAQALVAELGGN